MARSPKEAIVIVWDIGSSALNDTEGFYEKSQACISMILQRKIFSKSKDEIGLVLVGSNKTDNRLEYENISIVFHLTLATFDMLEYVNDKIKPTNVTADWLDGLVVALDFMKERTEGKKFTAKKIVLFSKFASTVCEDQVDVIIENMKGEDIQLVVIGPDLLAESKHDVKQDTQVNGSDLSSNEDFKPDAALILRILSELDGVLCSFEDAIPQLMFYQKKAVKPTPWNVDLEIGSSIKIPVSGYKKIEDNAALPSWKMTAGKREVKRIETEERHVETEERRVVTELMPVETEVSYFNQDENQTSIEKEEIIHGYNFGSTIVPFSDMDQAAMNYKSGPRSFCVVCTTSIKNIPRHLIMGTGVIYIFPRADSEASALALSALVTALHQLQMVAVVRRVYNANNAPKLGILYPKIRDSSKFLIFLELPYSEDMHDFIFPSLANEKKKLTEAQMDAVDALIDSMDLTSADSDGGEAFRPKKMLGPHQQYVFSCLSKRALHPDEPIPAPSETILQLLKSPFESNSSCKEKLKHLSSLFVLQEVVRKQARKAATDVFKQIEDDTAAEADDTKQIISLKEVVARDVIEVGTVTPEEDFKSLLKSGEPFMEVCKQMQNVIMNLVTHSFGEDDFGKAESALKLLREKCADLNPALYNDWILQFKDTLLNRHPNFWKLVTEGKSGLISTDENPSSTHSPQDAADFYQVNTDTKAATQQEQMDVDDLFDEM